MQEANAQLAEHDADVTPVQRRIEPRSADDSLSGVVRCLCFADTFLRDGENRGGKGFKYGSVTTWLVTSFYVTEFDIMILYYIKSIL